MSWKWSTDIPAPFFDQAREACADLGMHLEHLLGVAYAESGCRAGVPNALGSGAIGFVQFMPDTLAHLGWHRPATEFGRLNILDQLPYAVRYFAPYRGRLSTLAGVYLAVWMPADGEHHAEPGFVLSARGGRRGWAYAMNASFDENVDGQIEVRELEAAVRRNCVGLRWAEIVARAGVGWPLNPSPSRDDLRTTYGVQCALARLGYPAGVLDGLVGPRTVAAVCAYQRAAGLVVDGIPGRRTQAAMAAALAIPPATA